MSRQNKELDALLSPETRGAVQQIRGEAARCRVALRDARAELAELKAGPPVPFTELPMQAQRDIKRLRDEAKAYRLKLREAEDELAEANQRIASLMLDTADLKAGIIPQGA
jgi:chromosome segregation ATPase